MTTEQTQRPALAYRFQWRDNEGSIVQCCNRWHITSRLAGVCMRRNGGGTDEQLLSEPQVKVTDWINRHETRGY